LQTGEILHAFRNPEQAVHFLERVRWSGEPLCPYCSSASVGLHASADRDVRRWQCRTCGRVFSATVGTLFQGTHVPLRNWFLVLALVRQRGIDAGGSAIAKDLNMRRPTVSRMLAAIRSAIEEGGDDARLIERINAADAATGI